MTNSTKWLLLLMAMFIIMSLRIAYRDLHELRDAQRRIAVLEQRCSQ